jgi:hypothetical protein
MPKLNLALLDCYISSTVWGTSDYIAGHSSTGAADRPGDATTSTMKSPDVGSLATGH